MLRALLVMRGTRLTARQLGTLSGLSSSSGSFATYIANLRALNLVASDAEGLALTDLGRKTARERGGDLPGATDIVEAWLGRMPAGARRIFGVVRRFGKASRGLIASETGLSASSGSFSMYIADLVGNGLLERRGQDFIVGQAIEALAARVRERPHG